MLIKIHHVAFNLIIITKKFDYYHKEINASSWWEVCLQMPMFLVIVICGSPSIVRDIMLSAHDLGMTQSGEYVFINIDVSVG